MSDNKTKKYYKISFVLAAPLAIGSGENEYTDSDIIKDSKGVPYIPATAIAGVTRELMERGKYKDNKAIIKYYYGSEDKNKNDDFSNSNLIFYDATIDEGQNNYISVRDNVALDEYKTAVDGAKFDREILEPGIKFTTYIEENVTDGKDDMAYDIVQEFLNNSVTFGAKTARGFGVIKDAIVNARSFNLGDDNEIDEWLDFDVYGGEYTDSITADKSAYSSKQLVLNLKQAGGISIRRYTTKPSEKGGDTQPDYEQLKVHIGDTVVPTIPGSSWSGALRHRMEELLGSDSDKSIKKLFGKAEGDKQKDKSKSRIYISESQIKGGSSKQISRNAIDRFTGGTVDGALYTEETHYYGDTQLTIGYKSYDDADKMTEKEMRALAATLCDLHYGFLAVGGETSIGRGLFQITSLNDKAINEDSLYDDMFEAVKEVCE